MVTCSAKRSSSDGGSASGQPTRTAAAFSNSAMARSMGLGGSGGGGGDGGGGRVCAKKTARCEVLASHLPDEDLGMQRIFTSALATTTMATAAALSIDHAALGRVALKTWPEAKMVSASQLWATGPCLVFAVRRMG